MADEEAEVDQSPEKGIGEAVLKLRERLQKLEEVTLRQSNESAVQSSTIYCQEFCRTLLEFAGLWTIEEDPLPLVEVYIVALQSYAQASSYLSLQCENVPLVVERLSLSFVELLVSLKKNVPEALWKQFKSSVQFSSTKLQENGISQPSVLIGLCQYDGVWSNQVLKGLLSREKLPAEQVEKFLMREGPVLLEIRVKQLMKDNQTEKAAALAEACSLCPAFREKSSFKQLYLVCLCATSERDQLMEALSKEDCRDALEMICNLESDGDDKAAFSLCSAFLTRQLLQGDTYCAWELTLFWSKLLKRLEPLEQAYLDRCRQMSLLSKTMYHILFLIKVVQSEIDNTGLPVCIEMCIRALRMESDDGNTKASICKTISCLLPTDLEVKRACQLTQFLLEPTVDAYYVVETLYNEPDQKVEEETMPVPNSLRCELLLVLKTHWPFDPEFWDWRTLKRQCLALMGEEASIVSSIDLLNDNEESQQEEDSFSKDCFNSTSQDFMSDVYNLPDVEERRQKNREIKKLRGKDFISTKYRNWQAYMQYCVLCDKEFLGHRIVRHAQIHFSNGLYRCPICAQSFSSKDVFLPHVKSHVKQSSKERLNALKTTTEQVHSPEVIIPDSAAVKVKEDNYLKEKFVSQLNNGMVLPHVEIRLSRCDMETIDNYVCPVGKCRRSFKFLKNLVAHVKGHGNNKEAKTFLEMRRKKVICQYCRRHFVSVTHLNDHLQAHYGENPYICIQLDCKASFQSYTELVEHKKNHPVFKAKCVFPNCGKIFSQAFKLYDHEKFHYERFVCQAKDCGRVFQSLKLLDLHQEKHVSIKKERISGAKPQDMQPASLIKQMLTNNNQSESSPGKPSSESAADHKCRQSPFSTEGSCKPSEVPVDPQHKIRSLQTSQSENLINSGIQPALPNVYGSTRHNSEFGGHSFDSTGPLKSKDSNAQTPKSQPQIFHTNVVGSLAYKSECNLPLPEQKEPICSSRLLSVLPLHTPIEPVSQTFSPSKLEKSATIISGTAPPAEQKKQYHCPLENCQRCYVSLQSVNRHMRKVHSDFYEKWKRVRTPIKVTCVLAPKLPQMNYGGLCNQQNHSLPVIGVPRRNNIQFPVFMSASPNSAPLQSQSSQNQNASVKVENVSSPIVLSQPRSDGNQNGQRWHSASANERIQQSGSSNICSYNMQGMAQVECMNTALLVNTPSFSIMAAATPAETLQTPPLGSGSLSVLPSYITGTKEPSHQSQMQNSRTSSSADGVQSVQKHAEVEVPSSESASQNSTNTQTQNLPGFTNNDPNDPKQTKRHTSKWPAIVQNGKFVCCQCFKEFSNPMSFGGHLSRGAVCRAEKPGLDTNLPKSSVHFLHSTQTIAPQPSSCLNQNDAVRPSVINGLTANNLNFPSDKVPLYGNGKLDGINETSTQTNMPDYYQTSNSLPPPPYCTAELLLGDSVIHPTETVQANCRGPCLFPAAHYCQPCFKTCEGTQTSNPTHCQITVGPESTKQREDYNCQGQRFETTVEEDANLNSIPQEMLGDSQANLSVHGKLAEAQKEMSNRDVKRRLRELMLAEHFQRETRNMNTTTSLNHPVSFASQGNPPRISDVRQLSWDPSSNSVNRNSGVIPETSGEIRHSFNTPSFTVFRESSVKQQETLSPKVVITHDADLEPSLSSASQQQCITEIQSAFEKLDLVTEVSAQMSVPVKPYRTTVISAAGPTNGKVLCPEQFKPFACETKDCTARFMTGDALWRHLSKMHNYTADMVKMARKRYFLKYTPFKCQKCDKSFTRNTTLRVHYHSAHKLSAKEIEDMGVRCRQVVSSSQGTTPTHSSVENKTSLYSSLDAVRHDCPSQTSVRSPDVATSNDKCQDVSHVTPSQHLQAAGPCSQANGLHSLNNQSAVKSETKNPRNVEIRKKTKERKPSSDHGTSLFRPYRCTHQGCEAAFTVQHSLILHYRVVHQSALSALAVSRDQAQNNGLDDLQRQDEDYAEEQVFKISEFRCQVKDCSRIFQEVPNLVQHYLRLHHIGVDHMGVLLSNIKPQTFICGYQGCPALFTTACRYIGHIREQHNDMLAQPEQFSSSFRCEFEGCKRSYATKSNMLRHFMNVHGKLYRAKLKKERINRAKMKRSSSALRYQITKTMNGKENIESHRKIWKRGDPKKKKRPKANIWTTYGKPSLKTKVEASVLCTKKFPLQYPCMIIGCQSVMKSERHILKHYLGHGLSEKYLEHQRSHFIFCKKAPRLKWSSLRSDDSKSDSELSSSELTAETSPDEDDSGGSKLAPRKRTSAKIPIVLFDSKLSNIEGFAGSVVFKRKRGRPRKFPERVKPKKIPHPTLDLDCSRVEDSDFSSPALMQEEVTKLSAPLATFKPMGFEMSFLKFLEQSNKADHSVMMKVDVPDRFRKSSVQNAEDICVRFRNHKKLRSLNKVKIIIDGAFADVTTLMLTQLQDMCPTVVLRGK